ncbi:amidohydrolase family protein [Bradyrhizobium sp. NP1]|uniref:amidohydrolase n=1 Tax=Bradyrhizobium sp. NP1 TaxID=3049772 RepID=UPI0025A4DC72|nr:amidohydrolase family protein [Bradyrhizobium sp. NP1]WJR76625.1 amidohydrolase family protein [Bradyrhizobium sp. NP1]
MATHPHQPVVLFGARVHAFDGRDGADAVLISGGRVAALGRKKDVLANIPTGTRRIDVGDATIMPGLIDTHPHLLHYGSLQRPLVDIADAVDHADICRRIAARAATTPEGEWIMTTPVGDAHYFIKRSFKDLAEGDLPTRQVLDQATSVHPVVIQAWAPRLPNAIAFNSLALEKLGITRETPERVANVWIEKDAEGVPTGRLRGSVTNYYNNDTFANDLWLKIPFLKYEHLEPGTRDAIAAYHKVGVTAVYENHMMDRSLIDAYRSLRDKGELELRVLASQEAEAYGMPWSKPRPMPDFMRRLENAASSIELSHDRFRFNGVTIMWDGTCFPGGMMMKEEYEGPYGEKTKGFYHITPEKAEIVMRFCAERRIRLNTMCMGAQANEENLAMLERVAREFDIRSLRWVLVHAVFIEPQQIKRYAKLNMALTTSMSFCWGKGDLFRQRMKHVKLDELQPLRLFFDSGFDIAGGSDWGPKNSFEQIELALTHEFGCSGHRNLGPNQKIDRAEALSMWTTGAASVMEWPEIGSLAVGCYGDVVVVDRDLAACPEAEIGKARALMTMVGGHVVHDCGDIPGAT